MIWYILISLIAALLLWILLAPVVVYLDTVTNRYALSLPLVFRAAAEPAEGLFRIRGWIFFIPYRFNPFKMKRKPKSMKKQQKEANKKAGKKINRKNIWENLGMMRDLFRALKFRQMDLNIDTSDFMLNAWLVPVFSTLNHGNTRMRVNFEGDFSLLMEMRLRIGTILWIYIRNKLKSYF
jgi:hypothetical protein